MSYLLQEKRGYKLLRVVIYKISTYCSCMNAVRMRVPYERDCMHVQFQIIVLFIMYNPIKSLEREIYIQPIENKESNGERGKQTLAHKRTR
jgi:hypothetical protein